MEYPVAHSRDQFAQTFKVRSYFHILIAFSTQNIGIYVAVRNILTSISTNNAYVVKGSHQNTKITKKKCYTFFVGLFYSLIFSCSFLITLCKSAVCF